MLALVEQKGWRVSILIYTYSWRDSKLPFVLKGILILSYAFGVNSYGLHERKQAKIQFTKNESSVASYFAHSGEQCSAFSYKYFILCHFSHWINCWIFVESESWINLHSVCGLQITFELNLTIFKTWIWVRTWLIILLTNNVKEILHGFSWELICGIHHSTIGKIK